MSLEMTVIEELEQHAREKQKLVDRGWPDSLIKAVWDPFNYMLQLRTGQIFSFSEARVCGDTDWVTLVTEDDPWHPAARGKSIHFLRGVDVRIADIVWVADCGK